LRGGSGLAFSEVIPTNAEKVKKSGVSGEKFSLYTPKNV
jgi:hypothetical protein